MNEELWNIEDIIKRIRQGDEDAFEELVKKYEKLIYYIAIQRVPDIADAKDIVQETWMEVRKSISKLKEPRFFKAWLNKIVCSKVSRYYEKQKDNIIGHNEEMRLYKQAETRYYMDPQQSFHYQNTREILEACLSELKDIYREVLVLQYFEGFSMIEIAEALNIPVGTVKSRLNVAKKELRKVIDRMEREDGIHLDFHSVGMGALAAMLYGNEVQKTPSYLPQKKYNKKWDFLSQLQAHPMMAISLTAVIGFTALIGVNALPNMRNVNSTELTQPETTETKRDGNPYPFPEVSFRGTMIYNARDAYHVLYDCAFTSVQKDEEEMKQLYDVLIQYGGSYSDMAKHLEEYFDF